jgi:hypothetical protein
LSCGDAIVPCSTAIPSRIEVKDLATDQEVAKLSLFRVPYLSKIALLDNWGLKLLTDCNSKSEIPLYLSKTILPLRITKKACPKVPSRRAMAAASSNFCSDIPWLCALASGQAKEGTAGGVLGDPMETIGGCTTVTNGGCSGLTSVPPHAFKNVNMRNTRQNLKLSRDICIPPWITARSQSFSN